MGNKPRLPLMFAFEVPMRPAGQSQPHTHDFHEFFFGLEGQGHQFNGVETVVCRRNDLFFFPAGQPHRAIGAQDGWLGAVVYIEASGVGMHEGAGRVLEALSRHAWERSSRVGLSGAGIDGFRSLFGRIRRELRGRRPGFGFACALLKQELLLLLLRHADIGGEWDGATGASGAGRIEEVCAFLERSYGLPVTVERAVRMAHMSRSHFHATFREVTGTTFVRYLTRLRVRQAVRMLSETDDTVAEVAERCGFMSVSRFYNVFRRETGMAPGQARRRERGAGGGEP